MKILVTGANGQLGYDVVANAIARGHDAVGIDIADVDITDSDAVEKAVAETSPDVIIHCAAWTAVDAAEDSENADKVRSVNVIGTENIARACHNSDCKLIYISTDYVFNGAGTTPWKPDDACNPISVYGKTKYEGEVVAAQYCTKAFIVRIAWVFGGVRDNCNNFVRTMLKLGRSRDSMGIVNDQIGTPTYTVDLARLLVDMAESERYGKYHVTNSEGSNGEYVSWFDFASEIFEQAAVDVNVTPVDSSAYPTKAKRPSNSRLCKSKLTENGFVPLPDWRDAVKRYLVELGEI